MLKHNLLLMCLVACISLSGCAPPLVNDERFDGRFVLGSCLPILMPGSYVLIKNLSSKTDCLQIKADHVTIDLHGFTITGSGEGAGITTLNAKRKSIALYNGNIIGFNTGIDMNNVRDAVIENMRVSNNKNYGMLVGLSETGGNNPNIIIKDCIAIDNGSDISAIGILVNNSAGSITAANSVSIGNKFQYMDLDHGLVMNSVGHHLMVGNCPALIMGNNFGKLTSLDPPSVFATDCKVVNNIPGGLTP